MAGSRISWSDVRALYDTLNTAQTRFSQSRTTAPSNEGRRTRESDITTLKNEIENLRNVSYVGTQATFSNFTAPRANELMKRVPLEEIRSKLDTINGICAYDGANYTSNNGYRGANYTSDNSYHSSYYTSNNSQRSSNYSSNYTYYTANYSSNNGNRSSNYSSNNGNRSANYSSNYTYRSAYASNSSNRSGAGRVRS